MKRRSARSIQRTADVDLGPGHAGDHVAGAAGVLGQARVPRAGALDPGRWRFALAAGQQGQRQASEARRSFGAPAVVGAEAGAVTFGLVGLRNRARQVGSTPMKATTAHRSASLRWNSQAGMPLILMPWRVIQYSSRGFQRALASTSGPGTGCMLMPDRAWAKPGRHGIARNARGTDAAPRSTCCGAPSGGTRLRAHGACTE
jgi:hypothetical protein